MNTEILKLTPELGRNNAGIPLAVARVATDSCVYVHIPQEKVSDHFDPLENSENPSVIKSDS